MNLFIGSLSQETTEMSLRKLFSEFGRVLTVKVPRDINTGLPRGFAFVEFEDKEAAIDAIDNIDCSYFEGQIISVKEARPPGTGPGKPGGNSGGYQGRPSPGGGGFKKKY